jgi:hypothetical protein
MVPNDLILLIPFPRLSFIHHLLVLDAGSHIFLLLRTVTFPDIFGFFSSTPHLYYLTTHVSSLPSLLCCFHTSDLLARCIVRVSLVLCRIMRNMCKIMINLPAGVLPVLPIVRDEPNRPDKRCYCRAPAAATDQGCSTNPQKCYESLQLCFICYDLTKIPGRPGTSIEFHLITVMSFATVQ